VQTAISGSAAAIGVGGGDRAGGIATTCRRPRWRL